MPKTYRLTKSGAALTHLNCARQLLAGLGDSREHLAALAAIDLAVEYTISVCALRRGTLANFFSPRKVDHEKSIRT